MLIKCFIAGLMITTLAVSAPLFVTPKKEKTMFQHALELPFGPHLIGDGKGLVDWYFAHCCTANVYTLRNKERDLRHLLQFLSSHLGKPPHEIQIGDCTRQVLEEFVAHRIKEGDSPGTVNNRIALVKHLWNEPCRHFPFLYNPTQWIRSLKADRIIWGPIPEDKMERAIEAAYRTGFSHYVRYRAGFLVETMIRTGLRAHDLGNIKLKQLSPTRAWFMQIPCKGRKYRNVYLPEQMRAQTDAYLHYREEAISATQAGYRFLSEDEKGEYPLFVSVHRAKLTTPESFKLTRENMTRILLFVQEECGFKITARMLRHRFAHNLLKRTKDIRLVCQALGHSDIRTTMRYTERTDEELGQLLEDAAQGRIAA